MTDNPPNHDLPHEHNVAEFSVGEISRAVKRTLEGTFDMVFLDHWKDLYLGDLQLMEEHGLLKPGSIVVADNVGEFFGAEPYLQYVRESGKFDSENRVATIEYTSLPDAVEISVYR